uniref:Uncharacterized protein n=1 Tax=Ursus americanus TaxID=9643 RepID=A0A452SU85_URSAM
MESGTICWDPMASCCKKCGQQDPIYLPYTSVRITEAEMRAYHHFLESCTRLEYMAKQAELSFTCPGVMKGYRGMSSPALVAKATHCTEMSTSAVVGSYKDPM